MGIKKLPKKNSPTPAGFPSATSDLVKVYAFIVQVLLLIWDGSGSRTAENADANC